MTEQEQHELLIRLEVGQKNLGDSVKEIKVDVKDLKASLGTKPCEANLVRIKSLEWIVGGTLLAAISAMIKAFWPHGG